ncbi:MAG: hypothetical protein ACOZAL_01950 [Patescibacteria group bacterium]
MAKFSKNHLFFIGGTIGFSVLLFVFVALAQTPEIDRDKAQALIETKGGPGGCRTYEDCVGFCDNPDNIRTCLDYAEDNDLMSYDDVQRAERFIEIGLEGPGGCNSEETCRAYCDESGHMLECLEFALDNNLIPPDEVEEATKVLTALRAGATPPGGCANKEECEAYCDNPDHMDECLAFGLAAGFISSEEAEMIRRTGGQGPGGCRGREQCDAYCEDPIHSEECISFAVEHGFMSAEEAEMARKTGGKGPGGCKNKEDCDKYCNDSAHAEECINFAVEHGFMPPEEAEQAKKFMKAGGQGPGGCKGKEECEIYCSNPEHGEECMKFAVEMGFMSQEEADKMKNFVDQGGPGGCKTEEECRAFCEQPENRETCFNFGVQQGFIKPEEAEQMRRGMEMMEQGGPGGCKSEEECRVYCDNLEHQKECFDFAEQKGLVPPEEMQEMKEEVREGLRMDGMPEELKECLRTNLGEEFDRIQRGESVPGPEFGRFVSECAQQMQKPIGPPEGMPQGPPEGAPGPPEQYYPGPPSEGVPPEGYPGPPAEEQPIQSPEFQPPPQQEFPPPPSETPPEFQAPPESPPPAESTPPPESPPPSPEGEGAGFLEKGIIILRQGAGVLLNLLLELFK